MLFFKIYLFTVSKSFFQIVIVPKSSNFAAFSIIVYFLSKVAIPVKIYVNVRGK